MADSPAGGKFVTADWRGPRTGFRGSLTWRALLVLLTFLAALPGAASAQFVLTADSLEDYNEFGEAVATSNGWAAVGAHGWWATFGLSRARGRVYLFRNVQGEWQQWGNYLFPEESPWDPQTFGYALAMSGDTLVVGAPALGETTAVDFAGAVYVYVYNGVEWVLNSRLTPSDGVDQDHFGYSVAISDGLIVVGSRYRQGSQPPSWTGAGGAYVFRYRNGTWEEEAVLLSSDLRPNDFLGTSVAAESNRVVVGAPGADLDPETVPREGAVYVFVQQDGAWVEEAKLVSPHPTGGYSFGWSLAMEGGSIYVGEPCIELLTYRTGYVNLFQRDESVWEYKRRFVPDDAVDRDLVGYSIAARNNLLLVSAHNAFVDGSSRRVGAAYLFKWDGQDWTQKVKLSSPDAYNFGYAVALSDTDAVIGADCCKKAWAYDLDALPLAREPVGDPAFDFELAAPYPNPFTSGTTIELSVERTGPVSVKVYDLLGRVVGTPFEGVLAAGESRTVRLDGRGLEAGVYFIRVRTAATLRTISVVRAE